MGWKRVETDDGHQCELVNPNTVREGSIWQCPDCLREYMVIVDEIAVETFDGDKVRVFVSREWKYLGPKS